MKDIKINNKNIILSGNKHNSNELKSSFQPKPVIHKPVTVQAVVQKKENTLKTLGKMLER